MTIFSPRAVNIIETFSKDEARRICSSVIQPEHIVLSILKKQNGLGFELLKQLKIDIAMLQEELERNLISNEENKKDSDYLAVIPMGRRTKSLIDIATIEAQTLENKYVGTEHLILACVRETDSITAKFFEKEGISLSSARLLVRTIQKNFKSSYISNSISDKKVDSKLTENNELNKIKELLSDGNDLFSNQNFSLQRDDEEKDNKKNQFGNYENQSFLAEYSRDITKEFREKKLDPVIGREKEILRLIQVISRRTKNNPILVGEPGVGKTAIVEGFAQSIINGNVPFGLLKKRVLSLDLAALVAGTKYRGEFEERMKKMMKEVKEDKDIILFIDELHTIIGAGGPEGQMDASNMLKPALSRGELQIIGATTNKEYNKYIEKDSALARRFQKITIEEPSDEDSIKILQGIKTQYEKFHGVIYDDDVISSIVKLSRRYIPEKFLPDKAIDILDEAGARKKIQEENKPSEINELESQIKALIDEKKHLVQEQDYENAAFVRDKVISLKRKFELFMKYWNENGCSQKLHVTSKDITQIIGEITGIPVEQLDTTESSRLINMESELHKEVVGQEDAVHIISGAIRRSRAGISSPKHPIGSFIFLGSTGVGKTQLAKSLAKFIFGSEEHLIRIDMSDFMEKHNASRLVGAPPGYVGYEDGGILTEKIRQHPYSVILLDEIEKAHPDVFNLLLQILEEGELSDNLGHTVNFKNTVIIMTSNAGAREITTNGRVGFSSDSNNVLSYDEIRTSANQELKKLLSPELINRIDDVIVFNTLSKKEISKILDIQIAELSSRLAEKSLSISFKKSAKEYLIEKGYDPTMGARPMRRLIQKEIEDPLSIELLDEKNRGISDIIVYCSKEKLKIKFENINTTTIKCISSDNSDSSTVVTTINLLEEKK